ncbi:amino acid permease [Rhodanobacter sp. Root627]|jgi:APA family basic amino acid/polyamine antiporter|uniref:amino acid permease n=1 Tax=Rhodanobacter sp. Root627 TaxID=1736572 RepID=UPI000700AE63|nr:amino acid permease [Rhodanobacter sp. Root627]KRA31830.1 amino acid permease [Rhodanobacter sp. Root627]
MGFIAKLVRHKSIEHLQAEAGQRGDFRRVLGLWQLTAIGVGAIVGVGIFVLAGQQAAANAGPAVVLSFLIAGLGSACAALAYAEFSGLIPVTGSAYTYSYAVLGELFAWIIGWDLLIEYALIVGVVAIGWSGYVQALIEQLFGAHLPVWAQGAYDPRNPDSGKVFNVIAAGITLLIAWMLTVKTEWGARANTVIVAIKVIGVALVIGVGAFYVNTANWHPFIPAAITTEGLTQYGWGGVLAASSIVFFAVFGYDTLTTAAEESTNPQRDLPRAVLLSLAVSMALYVMVSLVLTGMVPYQQLAGPAPVDAAFKALGLHWVRGIISVAAVAGITSVMFAFMLGAARIWFALARDGLLPKWFARVHPKYGTPARPTIILGVFTALVAGSLPIGEVAELVNIGTLAAFIIICGSVLLLRVRKPDLPRGFRTPALWLVAPAGMLFSLFLIIGWPWFSDGRFHLLGGLPWITIERFIIWMALGLVIYFGFGIRHSRLEREP